MRSRTVIAVSVLALVGASACGSGARQALGIERSTPDEFRVVTIAPLVVPPEYSLRPPQPGEPDPAELFPDRSARQALFGDYEASGASQGEIAFAQRAGAADANPNARELIDGETAGVVRKDAGFADRLLFWRGLGQGSGGRAAPLDPAEEAERIEEITGGQEVVIGRPRTVNRRIPGI